jgi:hypothetical protein
MRAVAVAALALALAAGLISGCSLLPVGTPIPEDQLPPGVKVVTPQGQVRLRGENFTTKAFVLVVNGQARNVAAGDTAELGVGDLGPMPWDVAFETIAGRRLIGVTVHDGDVWRLRGQDGSVEYSAPGARADLSCGQLRINLNGLLLGPAPGTGAPGDCD